MSIFRMLPSALILASLIAMLRDPGDAAAGANDHSHMAVGGSAGSRQLTPADRGQRRVAPSRQHQPGSHRFLKYLHSSAARRITVTHGYN